MAEITTSGLKKTDVRHMGIFLPVATSTISRSAILHGGSKKNVSQGIVATHVR